MKIFHQNIRGLFGKFECLEELLDRHSSIDILALTETHIIDGQYDDNDNLFKIPGYQFIKRNRKDGKGGGVSMFIKDGVEWKRRHDMEHENLECIWIEVHIKDSKSILVAMYYRPPEGSTYLSANFNESILGKRSINVYRSLRKLLFWETLTSIT